MTGRLVVALIVAPLACALAFAIWIVMAAEAEPPRAPFLMLLIPGLMMGVLFEVVALIPLVYWLGRRQSLSRSKVIWGGLILWVVAVTLQLWVTSEIPFPQFLIAFPTLMIPGIALVLAFAYTISYASSA